MKNKIEEIITNNTYLLTNNKAIKEATKELYNLFLDEQIKLLTELYNSCPTDVIQKNIHELLKNKQIELQKLKQL